MVNINIAYTSRINPAGATPVLNEAQIWAGLQRKIRFAQEFVPVIESCEVLEEKDGVVTRDVKFKKGTGPKDQAKEVVRSYWPSWVSGTRPQGRYLKHDETLATPQFDVGKYADYMYTGRFRARRRKSCPQHHLRWSIW
jgi:hypothetical protein